MRHCFGFALAFLVACGGQAAAPTTPAAAANAAATAPTPPTATATPAGSPDCGTATNAALDRMLVSSKPDPATLTPAQQQQVAQAEVRMKEVMPKLKAATSDACETDKWSPDLVRCVGAATTEADFGKCTQLMTPDQVAHAQAAMNKVMTDAGFGGDPGGAAPAP